MTESELRGTLALVHPYVKDDYAGREGDIGIIAHIDSEKSEIVLQFKDGKEAIYDFDGIYMLKNCEKAFSEKGAEMNLDDYKDLCKIALLQSMGRGKDIWSALEIARDNPGIWRASLISIEKSLLMTNYNYIGR